MGDRRLLRLTANRSSDCADGTLLSGTEDRLRMVGLASETEFECPLKQYILADALGLSAIHVNRVLRENC
jgi:hypothetical protein